MIDFGPEGNPELPARITLYMHLTRHLMDCVERYITARPWERSRVDRIENLEDVRLILFEQPGAVKLKRRPLVLPTLGSDEVVLMDATTIKIGSLTPVYSDSETPLTNAKDGYLKDNDFLWIDFQLFRDGSPLVVEGDNMDAESPNLYTLVLGRELFPCFTQTDETIVDFTIEKWRSAQKHYLSDAECETVLSCIRDSGCPKEVC